MTDKDKAGTMAGATTGTNIVVEVEHRPEIVLLDKGKAELLFAHIQAEVEAFEPDMTTARGRDACRALAAKVTKTKTTVDKSRLALTEDARQKIKTINEAGSTIKERLEALADRARAPLTAWEEAEDARLAACKALLDMLRTAAVVPMGATSASLRLRIAEVQSVSLDEPTWQGLLDQATETQGTALTALRAALERVEQEEKDRAELAALRAAEDARLAAQAAETERLADEQRKKEAQAAYTEAIIQHITDCGNGMIGGQPYPYGILIRELEEKVPPEIEKLGDRKDEVERHRAATLEKVNAAMEKQAAAAEERDRELQVSAAARAREEERTLQREQAEAAAAEQSRAHEAELAAVAARAEEAERQAQAEREQREAQDRQRAEQEAAAAAERARLEKDRARRTRVMSEAKLAVMSCGVDEETARKVILAIMAGEVPRVILDFAAEPVATTKKDGELL